MACDVLLKHAQQRVSSHVQYGCQIPKHTGHHIINHIFNDTLVKMNTIGIQQIKILCLQKEKEYQNISRTRIRHQPELFMCMILV